MHPTVVRRDLSGFQHLHPTMQADGIWMAEVTPSTAGVWRAFADLTTDRDTATLGLPGRPRRPAGHRPEKPYVGARGHLPALRDGDLAFPHVHPIDAAAPGTFIRFSAALPGLGRSRLFLQFRHRCLYPRPPFTLEVPVTRSIYLGHPRG
jgi:hypothetical protein